MKFGKSDGSCFEEIISDNKQLLLLYEKIVMANAGFNYSFAASLENDEQNRVTTAPVIDPFANILGIMINKHYLEISGQK
ncbi:MAG: hypothetical protein ABIQ40_00875 [Bacteroidia bacterium]